MPAAVILGITGGLLGSFFISINFKMAILRKKYLTTKWIKPIETFMFCFVTASFFYWVPRLTNICQVIEWDGEGDGVKFPGWCVVSQKKGTETFNGLASLFWNTEGGVIRAIMDNKINLLFINQFLFVGVWYLFTITTYGTNVPAGLFLPGMIIGCALGMIYTSISVNFGFTDDTSVDYEALRKKFIVLGCAGFMAGYTRMTYSLGVILMETSQDLSLFVPMIFTIIISN